MNQLKIAFDVDNTLIKYSLDRDTPKYDIIMIYNFLKAQGHYMIIWSGGGKDYARMWAEKLGLNPDEVRDKLGKKYDDVDICFDDEEVNLGKINIKV